MDQDELLKRRQLQRRRQLKEERIKKQKRNRLIALCSLVVLIIILIIVIASIAKSCGNPSSQTSVTSTPTETTTSSSTDETTAPTTKPTESQTIIPIKDDGKDGEMVGGLYIWNNSGFELFYGGETSAKAYADKISSYKEKLGDDITVYNMVVPNHTEFGLPDRLTNSLQADSQTLSQRENTSNVYNNYSANVKAVDVYDKLNQHKTEYLYFNTDHHWTGLGAYYAYTKFAEVAGLTPLSLDDCTKNSISGFTGSLYTMTSDQRLANNADTVNYYTLPGDYSCTIPNIADYPIDMYYTMAEAGSNTYGVFLWGDNPLTVIDNNDNDSGDKIAIVKESYGNAVSSYFAYNYDETHIIDFRHFDGKLKDYCAENGIKTVLFVNGVMSANTPLQLSNMDTLF